VTTTEQDLARVEVHLAAIAAERDAHLRRIEDEHSRPVPRADRVVAVDRGDLAAVLAEVQALRVIVTRLAPGALGASYAPSPRNVQAFRAMSAAGGFRLAGSYPDITVGYARYSARRREPVDGAPR
jgi:hypothetical protein